MIEQKIDEIKKVLPIDKSFDVIGRKINIGDRMAYFIFLDGFAKDEILYFFLERIQNNCQSFFSVEEFMLKKVAHIESEVVKEDGYKKLKDSVLVGMFGIIFEDFDEYLLLDTRTYPTRSIGESEVEKVIRGAKDSFVEAVVFNTALIRRRVRNENLVIEMLQIGTKSKTDITVAYIDGVVSKKLLDEVKSKIENIKTDTVILSSEYLEDFLFKKNWFNPLPLVKYTERPDVCASYLFEGHIVVIVDTCPVAIILPVSIFHFSQHIGDYNIKFINGTIIKIIRQLSIVASVVVAPIFVYMADETTIFSEIAKKGEVPDKIYFSFFGQIIILEVAFLLLQASSLSIPATVAPLIGVIGGLLLSDIAIKLGIVTPIALLTMAITVITTYSIPSIEFTDSVRIFRIVMIVFAGFFGLYGIVLSLIGILFIALTTQTFDNSNSYTYPLVPFNYKDLKNLLIREHAKDLDHGNKTQKI